MLYFPRFTFYSIFITYFLSRLLLTDSDSPSKNEFSTGHYYLQKYILFTFSQSTYVLLNALRRSENNCRTSGRNHTFLFVYLHSYVFNLLQVKYLIHYGSYLLFTHCIKTFPRMTFSCPTFLSQLYLYCQKQFQVFKYVNCWKILDNFNGTYFTFVK